MRDEHLGTIPEKESDELIKSSVENLVRTPSESEDFSDNESECDPKELNLEIANTILESFSPSPILVKDSDSHMEEEIDLFLTSNDFMPPGIEDFDYELEGRYFNDFDELNDDECFDPGGGKINVKVDNSFTFVTWIFLPYLTYPEISPLLSSTRNEDTIFDPGISI
ncbi:hypothetical protein Tco_0540787 [Tanacetum coccineum]